MGERVAGTPPPLKKKGRSRRESGRKKETSWGRHSHQRQKPGKRGEMGQGGSSRRDRDRWQWGAWGQEARGAGHRRAGGQRCPRGEGGGGAECRPSRERDREKES